jgi:hypothetical protein
MSGLGWLDLQQYLEANREGEQQRADMDAAADFRESEAAINAANQGNTMPYSQYLAKRRLRESMGTGEAAGDRFLRANVDTGAPEVADLQNIERQRNQRQAAEKSYWEAQQKRNAGLRADEDARRKAQDDAFGAAQTAYRQFEGREPGYGRYSNKVQQSFLDARNPRGVRVITDDEYNKYGE